MWCSCLLLPHTSTDSQFNATCFAQKQLYSHPQCNLLHHCCHTMGQNVCVASLCLQKHSSALLGEQGHSLVRAATHSTCESANVTFWSRKSKQ